MTPSIAPTTSPSAGRPPLWGSAVAAFGRLAQTFTSNQAAAIALAFPVAVALLAPLGPLAANRFHRDEAVYSSWGLDIASGRDLLVSGSPVDKPPLFLYTQALSFALFGPTEVAARLPSLVASVIGVALTYALGRSLYGRGVGLLSAFLLAASPFAILFAPTAFTDPVMVAWMLAGCVAAVRGRWGWAGVALGLAALTKQQGVFFVPLAVGLGKISKSANTCTARRRKCRQIGKSPISNLQPPWPAVQPAPAAPRGPGDGPTSPGPRGGARTGNLRSPILSFAIAFLLVAGLALGWDVARARYPGFLVQSLASYGGLSPEPAAVWGRLLGFWELLQYGTGSPALNGILLAGLPLLLVVDILTCVCPAPPLLPPNSGGEGGWGDEGADLMLLGFTLAFLVSHSLVAFQVWDRYLLGLIPLLALLLARILTLPWRLLKSHAWRFPLRVPDSPIPPFLYLIFVLSVLSFTLRPVQDAAASRFPIGGDHGAYQGLEQVVGYLQTVPADTTLYHRWLGWHWRFYLWGSPYDFRAWTSPADLATQAAARPHARRYIVFPSWYSSTEARLALADVGLALHEVHRTFRDDGSVSFIIYRIEEAQ